MARYSTNRAGIQGPSMFKKTLYVQIRENRVHVRNIDDARTVERRASPGFSHPRMLIGDFTAAQACLKHALAEARGAGFAWTTDVVIHPLENIEGGLSQVEERLFRELAVGAGASKVVVWVGAGLGDAEVITRLKGR